MRPGASRSFAYRDADVEPTLPLGRTMLSFDLQGRAYRVAVDQQWPGTPHAMTTAAAEWLEAAQARAREAALEGEIGLGVVFVAPRLPMSLSAKKRFEVADSFIGASRGIRCRGCAFSFPDAHELARYRYGNDEYPGALLLVDGSFRAEDFSA